MDETEKRKTIKVAVTGGPCGGKSEGITYVCQALRELSVRTFVVEEIATRVFTTGISDIAEISQSDPDMYYAIEESIILDQIAQERICGARARIFSQDRSLVLCDRGGMDISAYVPSERFHAILEDNRLTYFDVRDSYDLVVHMVTAANGAEESYNTRNNKARREVTLEQARARDEETLRAWIGHPCLRIIDNSTDFIKKKERLLRQVQKAFENTEIERRFLLKHSPNFNIPELEHAEQFLLDQVYIILPSGEQARIRRRRNGGYSHYSKTSKAGEGVERRQLAEEHIRAMEYFRLREFRDPHTSSTCKYRWYFVYKYQYFELDMFIDPRSGLWILEIELTSTNDPIELPPFLDIEREVTDDREYSNYEISRRR